MRKINISPLTKYYNPFNTSVISRINAKYSHSRKHDENIIDQERFHGVFSEKNLMITYDFLMIKGAFILKYQKY